MRVLVIGNGAREHAIVWKLSQSSKVTQLYCAPGNPGIADIAQCVDIKAEDVDSLLNFALQNRIDLTVVGPELPLVKGIVDIFQENQLRIFGPCSKAAQLEGSKVFAKDFMQKHSIPTAKYKSYSEFEKAVVELQQFDLPVVIKADGLAAGKGVFIAQTRQEAVEAIYNIMGDKKFGEAGNSIIVEEFLQGREVSVLALVDGEIAVPMASAQDYKKALDGDAGLNTGGMGAISPAYGYSAEAEEAVRKEIIDKTMYALKAEEITYKGVLYFGIMLTNNGPKVLEFNVRFGDPEAEVILPRLQSDLFDIMNAVVEGKLSKAEINWTKESAVCVVLASGGYPEQYNTDYEIIGIESTQQNTIAFHSGTKLTDQGLMTAGGRVMVICAMGDNLGSARSKAYTAVKKIKFKNVHYRKDIALIN